MNDLLTNAARTEIPTSPATPSPIERLDACERASTASPTWALSAALLGFFIITLDALVVSVALPAIRETVGGGMIGLQWVMDGYTLPFAALLLLAGTLSDRLGARTTFGIGVVLFVASSAACAFAPTVELLIIARFVQGVGAAAMTPASLALIGEAYPDPIKKGRAIGIWAVGGAVASASGPLIGGMLTVIDWRLIFLINLPVGAIAFVLLARVSPSSRHVSSFDWAGQIASLIGLTALIYGLIETGDKGIGSVHVILSLAVAVVATAVFFVIQARSRSPMVPLDLFGSQTAATTIAIGFAFMYAFYGMVFIVSLFLQEQRGMNALQTGLAFAPVTAFSVFMPIIAARLAERFGSWLPITVGQVAMATGLLSLSVFSDTAPVPVLIASMIPVGIGGGLAMPSATSLLLNVSSRNRAGTASGVLNTSRQIGGAVAIAVAGTLISVQGYRQGVQNSLLIAATLIGITAIASFLLKSAVTK